MKMIKNIILFIFMVSSYLIACDSDQTDINGVCYFTADLDALAAFAINSGFSTEYVDVIERGDQTWGEDGRLTRWICNIDCNLTGVMPPEIGDLTELTALFLNNNNLEGSIPEEIGNLTELTALWLGDNLLEGTIPSEIINLINLASLSLSYNSLTGIIPNSLCNLPNIFVIDLKNNKFCENNADCSTIDSDVQDTSDCPDCDDDESPVDGVNCYSKADLDVLAIFANNSGMASEYGDVINMGSQEWDGDGRLTFLDCRNCGLSGSIPQEIGTLTSLSNLNLTYNELTGSIPSELGNLSKLTALRLYDNQLSGSIPPEIFNLPLADQFHLSNNQLSGSIPSNIGNLVKVRDLGLDGNQLSGSIPPEIGNLTILVKAYLNNNQLSGPPPSEFGTLSDLTELGLYNNELSGLIPDSFCNLSDDRLDLYNNQFCPPYPDCMTEEDVGSQYPDPSSCDDYCEDDETVVLDEGYIGCYDNSDLEFLEDIIAGSNNVSTSYDPWEIGHQIWEDRRLKSFCCSSMDLSTFSQLEGGLASCAADCPYVFNMSIPLSIGNLSALDTLALIGMDFDGSIPDTLRALMELDVLFISDNGEDFFGTIPEGIGNNPGLRHLSFSNNNLNGEIPSSLWSLPNLKSFDLSNNRFSGLIPNHVCDMNYITLPSYADNFMFDGNKFCPPFPNCINTNNENQNAILVSFYEDANQDGIGNEDVTCTESYCSAYPPMEGDCVGYVSACCDESDACSNNQTRDECGVCGGDGFHDDCTDGSCQNMDCNGDCKAGTLFECSEPNCGTAVIDDCGDCGGENIAMDGCGECDGPNTDCSSGYNAQTCPDMNEYCSGSCVESPVCIPQLESMSQTELNLVDINTRIINMYFTAPISYQVDGIEIESHDGTDIAFTYSNPANDVLEIVLVEPLISSDQLEISINPCKIKSLVDPIYQVQYCLDDGDDIPESIDENFEDIILNVALMGDFDMNGEVNQYDLDELLQVWKTEDFSYEMGPWEGTPPYLQAVEFGYDGDYDIHDLMGFVQMWNWDYETNGLFRKIESNVTMDYDLPFNFKNNQMTIHFQDYPGDMKRAWFQLKLDDSNVQVENLLSASEFDVVLNGFNEIQGAHDWVLGSFASINDRSINLFEIHSQIEGAKSFVLEYEIIGFDGEVSHGEINFTNNAMPEKIFINTPYPNPYNPVTKIEFGIPEKSNAFMEVHDIQGRLIDDKAMLNLEPGFHAFIWDGVDQPSGIYLIRIKINDRIKNFRTMLIK